MIIAMAMALVLFEGGVYSPRQTIFFLFLACGVACLAEGSLLITQHCCCCCYCSRCCRWHDRCHLVRLRCGVVICTHRCICGACRCPVRIILVSLSRGAAHTTCCLCCRSWSPPTTASSLRLFRRLLSFSAVCGFSEWWWRDNLLAMLIHCVLLQLKTKHGDNRSS